MIRTWSVRTVTDAARVRIAAARLAAACGVGTVERTRLVTALTAHLRQCLTKGGVWRVGVTATPMPGGGEFVLEVEAEGRRPQDRRRPWRTAISCAGGLDLSDGDHDGEDPTALAEALFGADEDTALLLERLDEQEALVAFHREELHQTNQGVLALHAELDAANQAQRRLFDAEQKARREAEAARGRLTFLADASAALTASLNHEAIVRLLPALLVPRYARAVDIWLFDGTESSSPDRGASHPAAAVVAARRERPQYAADHPGGLPGVDDQPPSALDPGRPLLCIPLLTRRAPQGVLTLTAPDEGWDADDAVMLIELTRRASIALENARRFEHNRDIAETLQRALLTDLPSTPGLTLAARYLPATRGLNIGGDWYDAFRQPDGSLITVVGDVTGHGLHAAVMMSQLRTALRAYAVDGSSPGQLLTRLHEFLHRLRMDLYATAVIARFHPDDDTLTWAAAGHPPPVLRGPDGEVVTLDAKPGAMLGIPLQQRIADHTAPLPPGSTLALYTDGLVERRAQGIDPGIRRLTEALATFRADELGQDLEGSADRLLHPLLHDSEHDDDVCLLLCHVHGGEHPA
ncbi:SpoIIE family protein phosphatase [Streptomyces sp. KAU_LT]|uniref:PP2C family protein-serine/threonine phosphatase n=1 Tax=unclassified Streptomyces TaxID=2593676 RepID=UPI0024B6C30A|nr:SpoIIE family protein phosphatase [Streptomyces sp. KAU_LT]MDI9835481.1 SpoIIE family protein phosphatase [Streptomyces sp. KAU_LT]